MEKETCVCVCVRKKNGEINKKAHTHRRRVAPGNCTARATEQSTVDCARQKILGGFLTSQAAVFCAFFVPGQLSRIHLLLLLLFAIHFQRHKCARKQRNFHVNIRRKKIIFTQMTPKTNYKPTRGLLLCF